MEPGRGAGASALRFVQAFGVEVSLPQGRPARVSVDALGGI